MNTTAYVINGILVLLVVRQIRGRRLDFQNLVLPVVLVGLAAAYFLHSIPTVGNDVTLDVILGLTGVVFGSLCGLFTRYRTDRDGMLVAWAGVAAAVFWVVGIGARMAFAYAAGHGAGPAIGHFSRAHSITGQDAWTAALVLMALAEVTSRLVVVRVRAWRMAPALSEPAASNA